MYFGLFVVGRRVFGFIICLLREGLLGSKAKMIVISKFLKQYSKAKGRAPAYS